jgi:lantibiotic modifying enzyme
MHNPIFDGALAAAVLGILFAAGGVTRADDRPYRDAALETARWIRSTAVRTEQGTAWPADPANRKSVGTGLYSGAAGIVLFFLEAHRATQDAAYLQDARAGADYLLRALPDEKESGLYVGLAGIGFALQETFKATGDAKYRDGARRCVQALTERARRVDQRADWNDTTDIIRGTAGIGPFLLYAARELQDPAARELAAAAGRQLIQQGQLVISGLRWTMSPGFDRRMPNFSHGTAGVAYFLATLYRETKSQPFLDAALSGASYLKAVAETGGDGCLIFHHEPGGEKLFYLGWCHGPAGTARLFYRLHQVTGDRAWLDWVRRSARSVLDSGIPEKQTPGFWNNVSQCCGSAGVAEFFLDLHRVTGDKQYLAFARRLTADLLARSTRDDKGRRWSSAEFRVKPEAVATQPGYMQGAAGIGMWLLHLDGFEHGREGRISLPDSPF